METVVVSRRIHTKVGFLNGLEEGIPDLSLFLGMYARKEALFSSQIEVTQATLKDIFNPTLAPIASRDIAGAIDNVNTVFLAVEAIRSAEGVLFVCFCYVRCIEYSLSIAEEKTRTSESFERYKIGLVPPAACLKRPRLFLRVRRI